MQIDLMVSIGTVGASPQLNEVLYHHFATVAAESTIVGQVFLRVLD